MLSGLPALGLSWGGPERRHQVEGRLWCPQCFTVFFPVASGGG